jgi:hypothetical protein
MARIIVITTLILWMILFMLAISVHNPQVGLLPLYALYPGEVESGPNYSPIILNIWAIGAGIVFLVLAILGTWGKSKGAAITFVILFLFSIVIACFRIAQTMSGLH